MNKFTSTFNFDDIGKKIKAIAKWSCWITIVLLWISAAIFFLVCLSNRYLNDMLWIPMVTAAFGPFVVWITFWPLYAFGELVDNSSILANPQKKAAEKQEKADNAREQKRIAENQKKQAKAAKSAIANTEISEEEFIDITCPHCGETLSYTKEQLQIPDGLVCPMCDNVFKI